MICSSRGRPACLAGLLLAASATFLPTPVLAHHYNRGHFVRAFAPCEAPNDTTSDGVAACAPAVLSSDCAVDPTGALQLAAPAKTSLTMMTTGRRHTRKEHGQPTIESRFGINRVLRCDGSGYSGSLTVRIVVRIQRDDPVCATGHCTLPDVTYHHALPCDDGRCKSLIEDFPLDLIDLPHDHGYAIHVVSVSVLDLSGNRFLTAGIGFGDDLDELSPATASLPRRWSRWLSSALSPAEAFAYGSTGTGDANRVTSRQVQAFARCELGATDTVTDDGLAACSTVFPSDCATDPSAAVIPDIPESGNYTDDGKGKVDLTLLTRETPVGLRARGAVDGLDDCVSAPYSGSASIDLRVRATVRDTACTGGSCTTVPTSMVTGPLESIEGQIGKASFRNGLGLDVSTGPGVTAVSAEIIDLELRDASGNPFMFGPSLLVRCNYGAGTPNEPGGEAFCFGN